MITHVEVVSALGDTLMMPLQDISSGYVVQDIDGLDPVRAVVSSSSFAQLDGEQYQSSKFEKRNIVLDIGFEPDWINNDVRGLRRGLYRYFMPKSSVSLRFYNDGEYFCWIPGRVETNDARIFGKDPGSNISILCFDPLFTAAEVTVEELNTVSDTTTTPVVYSGDVETGFLLRVFADRNFTGMTLFNQSGGIYQNLEFEAPILDGDELIISTVSRAKGAHVVRSGVEMSVLYGVSPDSSWVNLYPGENNLRLAVDGAAIPYQIEYTAKYGGL